MRKCYSLISVAVAVSSLIVPQTALAQYTKVRTAESTAKVEAKQVDPRVNLEMTAKSFNGSTKFASAKSVHSPFISAGTQAVASVLRANASSVLYGAVVYNGEWSQDNPLFGVYSMPVGGTPSFSEVFVDAGMQIYSGCIAGDVYVTSVKQSILGIITVITHNVYDANTWELLYSKAGSNQTLAPDMTYDPATDAIYGTFINAAGNGYVFGKFDIENCTVTEIAPVTAGFNGIATAPDGTIYGITGAGKLYTVNKTTGATTLVGETGIATKYLVSATCDPASGTLYYTLSPEDETGWLYTINKETAAATPVYQFPGDSEVVGLYIPAPAAEDKAPAATSEVALDFSQGSLTGSVKFTAPISLYDGTAVAAGTEGLTYHIKANGEEIATAATTYGAEINAQVTLPTAGEYKFIVTVSNEAGESPKMTAKAFVGNDVPKAPANVKLVYEGGKMKLSWDAVTESVNGGYVDPAAITYTVTRLNDNAVVAEGGSATSYEEAVAEPEELTSYQYSVKAVFAEFVSAAAESNAWTLGSILPPYSNGFDDESSINGFSIIDVNGDGKTWGWYDGAVRAKYNTKLAMDDWFVSPGFKLEAGKFYGFSVKARANGSSYPEKLEVKMGSAPTVDGMTTTLVPVTTLDSKEFVTLEASIIPETSGVYYIGFHGVSDADMFYLYIDDFVLGAAKDLGAPAAATGLVVTPDQTGALKANFAFTTPDKSIAGDEITSLTKVEVYNGENLLKTIENPACGVVIEESYENLTNGVNTFSVIAYNEAGAGLSAEASAFVGINVPGAPASATIEEISEGTVKVSWTAPEADVDGKPLNPAVVTYVVAELQGSSWVPVAKDITGYTWEYAAVPAGEQDFVQYAVFAETAAGTGEGTATGMIAVGTPYALPMAESFAEGSLSYIWGTKKVAGSGSWSIATDGKTFSDVTSQDADGGFAYFKGQALNDEGALFTGKINITGTAPALTFYYLPLGDDDINELRIKVDAGEGEQLVQTVVQTGEMGIWKKATVNLSAYIGKTVQIYFDAITLKKVYTIMDNIKIGELLANNLAVSSFSVPASVAVGEAFGIAVTVENFGTQAADNYTVNLYRDGELFASKVSDAALASGEKATFDFADTLTPLQEGAHAYFAEVVYAADEDTSDNKSATSDVTAKGNNYPVTTLTGEKDAATGFASLSWEAPVLGSGEAIEFTETFEDEAYESFTTESFGPWTLKNFNDAKTYSIQNATFPGMSGVFGYILMDAEAAGLGAGYAGYNGSADLNSGAGRCVQAFAHTSGANDAWLISPMLSGDAQTIKFMAACLDDTYGPETFEVLYSTTDQEVASFTLVEGASYTATLSWVEYTVTLPAGAKYFAIRSTATDTFVLSVDNITFKGYVNPNAGLEIVGYNIYRDGKKINDTPVTETNYLDTTAPDGLHTYVVTVVYNRGESKPSNEVTVTTSGVENIDADAIGAKVTVEARNIVITDAEGAGVVIVAADGKVIYTAAGEARTAVAVAPGVYVVKVAAKVVKVVVK